MLYEFSVLSFIMNSFFSIMDIFYNFQSSKKHVPYCFIRKPLFFDLFYIGEGETRYADLIALYRKCKKEGFDRKKFLHESAKIPGMYVPSLYEVQYAPDGTIASFNPVSEDIPKSVMKEAVMNVTDTCYPMKPVVPYIKITQDRVVLEIQRGCIRGCRFCQAVSVR